MVDATFKVLGPVQVRWPDGRQVQLGGKLCAVLATLLVNVNTVVSRERMVATLWEEPPASAIANLHTYVSQLRRALPPETRLSTKDTGYLLEAAVEEVDLLRFEQAVRLAHAAAEQGDLQAVARQYESALSMWRGRPAEGTTLAGPMLARVTELEERLAAARLDWAEAKIALGLPANAIEDLRLFVAEQPLRERAWHLIMLAHSQAGQRDKALEAFRQARSVLIDELGLEPGEELQQLQAGILAGTMVVNGSAPRAGVYRLPSDVKHFSGREAELAALDAFVLTEDEEPPYTATTCVISGTGGVGKTALAVHWAHRVREHFPDGQLYVDLQGFSPGATQMPSAQAVRILLGFLQPPHHGIPSTFEEQVGLYRNLLAGKRVLVILDNARETDQVRPLLSPSPGSLTLVTGRTVLTGLIATEGAHLLRLSPLSHAEAGRLLKRRLGQDRVSAEREAADDIIRTCAGLPLALGIVAARAIIDAGLPLTALAEELQAESTRLDALQTDELSTDLREVFGSSYGVLPAAAAGAFAQLGLAPGPDISLTAAASLIGRSVVQARSLLRTLETAHLLHQHVPGRYRMHDLVRLYAIERAARDLSEDERAAAVRRLVDFYLHTSYVADLLLSPRRRGMFELAPAAPGCLPRNLADAATAQEWFRAEHPCLLAAQRLAAEHGLHLAVWQLAWTLDTFHLGHNLLQTSVSTWRMASTVEHPEDSAAHALIHQMLGRACARAGHHEESLPHLAEALSLYERSGDIPGQAYVRHTLALAWEQQGEHEQALVHLEHALRLYRKVGDTTEEANALNSLGWNHALLADFADAQRHCEQALVLNRRHGDRLGEAATLDSLGYIAHNTGHHAQALDYYHHALDLRRASGYASKEAETLSRLGDTYHALGRHTEAAQSWNHALIIYRAQAHTTKTRHVQAKLDALRTLSI
ncbi:DNA-binding transcriptional activator of the SARP family [Nonomuraea solani]|uniref:DNA-binding transcriptional activator of the SARP family n=1 Tax=Nonomuraea solani TaxID=1144553 RepID=A0A1H6EV93_9ACTN|nr:BTAD domain-containing putative transcriptional regulator [Nonomuraea solani]SEH01830.1 DNA-binding transcriptional activator of the SARP family [Nonomuraea solani]